MLPLGTKLPFFRLEVVPKTSFCGVNKQEVVGYISSNDLENKPLLIMVICAHCPFVRHIESGITTLFEDYGDRVQIIAVSSNSLATHPQDGPDGLANQAQEQGWDFPYLMDPDQKLAKALKAACTPDFFLFSPAKNGEQGLRYRGQFDSSRPGNGELVTGEDLREAIDAVLAGSNVCKEQQPSIGCNIKWNPGKEPSWFG